MNWESFLMGICVGLAVAVVIFANYDDTIKGNACVKLTGNRVVPVVSCK